MNILKLKIEVLFFLVFEGLFVFGWLLLVCAAPGYYNLTKCGANQQRTTRLYPHPQRNKVIQPWCVLNFRRIQLFVVGFAAVCCPIGFAAGDDDVFIVQDIVDTDVQVQENLFDFPGFSTEKVQRIGCWRFCLCYNGVPDRRVWLQAQDGLRAAAGRVEREPEIIGPVERKGGKPETFPFVFYTKVGRRLGRAWHQEVVLVRQNTIESHGAGIVAREIHVRTRGVVVVAQVGGATQHPGGTWFVFKSRFNAHVLAIDARADQRGKLANRREEIRIGFRFIDEIGQYPVRRRRIAGARWMKPPSTLCTENGFRLPSTTAFRLRGERKISLNCGGFVPANPLA